MEKEVNILKIQGKNKKSKNIHVKNVTKKQKNLLTFPYRGRVRITFVMKHHEGRFYL